MRAGLDRGRNERSVVLVILVMGGLPLLLALVALEPYLPLVPGKYVYRSPAGEEMTVEVLAVEVEGAPGVVRFTSEPRQTVESFDPEAGLQIHRSGPAGLTELTYERPLAVLPSRMDQGELHTSQRRFVRRLGGQKLDVGSHYVEAELEAIEEISLASGSFPDCLRVRRHETRMDFSGTQEVYDATEWYARGVGLVKARGVRIEKDAEGATRSREPFDFTLVSTPP